MSNTSSLIPGLTLQNRYRIVCELGRGGFGRTYLARDLTLSNESCVLKEFAPQVQDSKDLQKAKELFEREAGVLYKLQHPQIPRFREMLRVKVVGEDALFLVQDYIEGENYLDLLKSYLKRGKCFSDREATELMLQILPVLEYIHSLGVIHRDISPDNLIQRQSDKLPILIDFGGVKQAAANAISLFNPLRNPTRIGKQVYAPDEQIIRGIADPSSDLYALAVTVLVLLTGKDPSELYDAQNAAWKWRQHATVDRSLGAILDRMLAYRPSDRYQSARGVIQALAAVDPKVSQMRTVNFFSKNERSTGAGTDSQKKQTVVIGRSNKNLLKRCAKVIVVATLAASVAGVGSWALLASGWLPLPFEEWLPWQPEKPMMKPEKDRSTLITKRRVALKIPGADFHRRVDAMFYAKYPNLNRQLTNKPEDEPLREEWYRMAEELLDRLEKSR
ncbi:MAG: serine/threonine protein kinase [Cyanosarcina radialis HA8281-LM2]|jgi:serine/threonine-protein kinase|nr:serine/threonine protein kinase [Cyanosarcina radialis HA8281-LM2]